MISPKWRKTWMISHCEMKCGIEGEVCWRCLFFTEAHSEPPKTSMMKIFEKIVNRRKPLTFLTKTFHLKCLTSSWIPLCALLKFNLKFFFIWYRCHKCTLEILWQEISLYFNDVLMRDERLSKWRNDERVKI